MKIKAVRIKCDTYVKSLMCYLSHCTNIQQIPYAYPTLGSADYISLLPSSQSRRKISHVQKYYQKIKGKVKQELHYSQIILGHYRRERSFIAYL